MSLFVKALMLVLISLHDGHAYTRQQCALFQLKYIFGFPFNCFDFLGDICFSGTGTAVPFNSANCMMMLPMENTWQAQNSNTAVTGYVSNHWVTVASDSGGTTCFEIISAYAAASTPPNSGGMSAWFMNHLTSNYLSQEFPHPQYPSNDNPYICIGNRRGLLRGGEDDEKPLDKNAEAGVGVRVMNKNMTKVMDVNEVSDLLEVIEATRTDDEMKENGPLSNMKAEELEMWLRVHG